jgi:hypothetical protein
MYVYLHMHMYIYEAFMYIYMYVYMYIYRGTVSMVIPSTVTSNNETDPSIV